MNAPYHRSPLRLWLLAWLTLGLAAPWCIGRLGKDLNAMVGREVVNVNFHMTLIGLLLTAYGLTSSTISTSLWTGFDLDQHGVSFNGVIVAAAVFFLSAAVAVLNAFAETNLRLNEALGEEADGPSTGFIVVLSLALLASLSYLQGRLNKLAVAKLPQLNSQPASAIA